MLLGYIFINRIQPFQAANISAAFFLCRPMRKHNRCHTFQNKFQDDISCTLAMYSFIWDSLYISWEFYYIFATIPAWFQSHGGYILLFILYRNKSKIFLKILYPPFLFIGNLLLPVLAKSMCVSSSNLSNVFCRTPLHNANW